MNSPLRLVLLRPFILLLFSLPVRAADPVVSNISAVQRAGTQLVDITYNVAADYPLSVGKLITWNAGTDWSGRVSTTMRFKGTATDVIPPSVPAGFSLIPAGSFTMGLEAASRVVSC
jgi:hypothetical protein